MHFLILKKGLETNYLKMGKDLTGTRQALAGYFTILNLDCLIYQMEIILSHNIAVRRISLQESEFSLHRVGHPLSSVILMSLWELGNKFLWCFALDVAVFRRDFAFLQEGREGGPTGSVYYLQKNCRGEVKLQPCEQMPMDIDCIKHPNDIASQSIWSRDLNNSVLDPSEPFIFEAKPDLGNINICIRGAAYKFRVRE
ncbi:hypothetical protein MJT46_010570 [Ovis ammon polii x Ovis aries]|nr:hypothetical protein MJT46_010570 [Ovis ammon polii x Ovis aries]